MIDVGDRFDEARALSGPRFPADGAGDAQPRVVQSAFRVRLRLSRFISPGNGARPDLAGFPVGLNGLVFALKGADAVHELRARGIPVQPVQRFSRNVDLPDGTQGEARFNAIRLAPRTVFDGRVYFCEHLTPELIWRPEWQAHPNGALAITRVAIAARDPDAVAENSTGCSVPARLRARHEDRPHVLRAGEVAVEIWPRDALARTLGAAMPDPAGRGDHMALVGIRVRSLDETKNMLRAEASGMSRSSLAAFSCRRPKR